MKCGIRGDRRFCNDEICHLESMQVHPKDVEKERIHRWYEKKKLTLVGTFFLEWYHPDSSLIHPKGKKLTTINGN